MTSYRILVTGSRSWDDRRTVWQAIASAVVANAPRTATIVLVHGACPQGADAHAAAWATAARGDNRRPVTEEAHPANWRPGGELDRSAGFRRNTEMVALGADICLAFIRDGSRGASHTAALAEQAGIETRRWTA